MPDRILTQEETQREKELEALRKKFLDGTLEDHQSYFDLVTNHLIFELERYANGYSQNPVISPVPFLVNLIRNTIKLLQHPPQERRKALTEFSKEHAGYLGLSNFIPMGGMERILMSLYVTYNHFPEELTKAVAKYMITRNNQEVIWERAEQLKQNRLGQAAEEKKSYIEEQAKEEALFRLESFKINLLEENKSYIDNMIEQRAVEILQARIAASNVAKEEEEKRQRELAMIEQMKKTIRDQAEQISVMKEIIEQLQTERQKAQETDEEEDDDFPFV
jgi:hypothetical protein